MTTLTESRDLHSVTHNAEAGTVAVVWMNRIYRDGTEIGAARAAETKTFTDAGELAAALGNDAAKYANLI